MKERLDELSLEWVHGVDRGWSGCEPRSELVIWVNERRLVDIVCEVELPFATAEYDSRKADGEAVEDYGPRDYLAGQYMPIPDDMVLLPSLNLLGEPYDSGFLVSEDDPSKGKSLLLSCTCSVIDCWFLLAKIEVTNEHVTWSKFQQFHRDWPYDLGPFIFDKQEYMHVLSGS